MDFDDLSKDERNDALAKIADLYYNQQMTQIEIANKFETTRFKIAKLLQDARDEQIVEIKINYSNARNHALERELTRAFDMRLSIVADTKYATFIEGLYELGKLGAARLTELLAASKQTTLGITWGKSIQSVIEQLSPMTNHEVSAVQMAGNFDSSRPTSESRELVRTAATIYFGTAYYLNAPLYAKSLATRDALMHEPDIQRTLSQASSLDVVLTGVGATASLPLHNPSFACYLNEKDHSANDFYPGSLYGYVLNSKGEIADIELNHHLVAVPLNDVLRARHKICIVHGRNKAPIAALVAKSGLINEIVTDAETASLMLEYR